MQTNPDMGFSDSGELEPVESLTPEERVELLQQYRARMHELGLSETEIMLFINLSSCDPNDLDDLRN